MKPSTFKPREKPLARRAPLARRSTHQQAVHAVQGRAYKEVNAAEAPWCMACGCSGPLDHSHCLTQGQHPKHRANPLNIVLLCRACHTTWENNKARFKLLYPAAFADKVRRMELIDRQAAAFFKLKNSDLFK